MTGWARPIGESTAAAAFGKSEDRRAPPAAGSGAGCSDRQRRCSRIRKATVAPGIGLADVREHCRELPRIARSLGRGVGRLGQDRRGEHLAVLQTAGRYVALPVRAVRLLGGQGRAHRIAERVVRRRRRAGGDGESAYQGPGCQGEGEKQRRPPPPALEPDAHIVARTIRHTLCSSRGSRGKVARALDWRWIERSGRAHHAIRAPTSCQLTSLIEHGRRVLAAPAFVVGVAGVLPHIEAQERAPRACRSARAPAPASRSMSSTWSSREKSFDWTASPR